MKSLDQLLQNAEKEGRYDSTGRFTVAVERYKNRIGKDFSTTYPSQYILRFIQSMVAFEASGMKLKSKRRTLEIEATILSKRSLSGYLSLALEHQSNIPKGDPTAPFLQGLWAALAENVRVTVRIEQNGRADIWDCRPDTLDREVVDCPLAPPDLARVRITFLRPAKRRSLEEKMMLLRCGYCPVPLEHNGRRIDGRRWEEEARHDKATWYAHYAPYRFRLAETYLPNKYGSLRTSLGLPPPSRRDAWDRDAVDWTPKPTNTFLFRNNPSAGSSAAALYIPVDLEGPGTVIPVLYGVALQPLRTSALPAGATAVVECLNWDLKTDVFGLRLVEDSELDRVLHRLRQEFRSLALPLKSSLGRLKAIRPNQTLSKVQMSAGALILGTAVVTGFGFQFLLGGVQLVGGYVLRGSEDSQNRRNRAFSNLTRERLNKAALR